MSGEVIEDHAHEWETRGLWRTGRCSACGEAVSRHLSYGVSLAATIGGNPLDYVG